MSSSLPAHLDQSWLDSNKEFCHPNWSLISHELDAHRDPIEMQDLYVHLGRLWMKQLQVEIPGEYELRESSNFFLLSKASEIKAVEALRFLEYCLYRIRSGMPFLPDHLGYGKWPVLCLDVESFYRYLSDYTVDDESNFAAVGGVFLNRGYGHFALPSEDLHLYSQVLAHELSHAVLAVLQMPLWLDEAITMDVEERLAGGSSYWLDREMVCRHQGYWDRDKVQAFWAGTSFWFPDDGQELSYHLARFLFRSLYRSGTTDPGRISEFIKRAKWNDGGYAEAVSLLDVDLAEVLSHLLGEGDWKPDLDAIQRLQKENVNAS